MSCIKRYFEDHIDEMSDEQLIQWGYSDKTIEWLRECFSTQYYREES